MNVEAEKLRPSDPASLSVRAALAGAIARFQANDEAARSGQVEGVHRLRTTTRRLRGELRAFRDLIEPEWREAIEGELKWLAASLGGVRDLDVLAERLIKAGARLSWNSREKEFDVTPAEALDPLFESLRTRHSQASAVLREALSSERYRQLVNRIGHAIDTVRDNLEEDAERPCREILPSLVRSAWKHLRRGARALEPDDPDEDFHDVRKRSKRARYTAELIAPSLGRRVQKEAGKFIELTTRVQDVLGEHQDAIVAIDEISRTRQEHDGDLRFIAATELLLEDQQRAAEDSKGEFFKLWKKVDRKSVRRWMDVA